MKKKRWISVSVAAAIAGGLFFIAGQLSSWKEATETVVEDEHINLYLVRTHGDNSWNRAMTQVIQEFEEQNPEINIISEDEDTEGLYEEYLIRKVATDTLGDIAEIRQFAFVENGCMAPLQEDLTDHMLNTYEMDGKIYGTGISLSSMGILYNKQIFRMLDLEVPRNYGEFLQICKILKSNGYTPVSVGGGVQWHMKLWLNHFYLTDIIMKDPEWAKGLRTGKASWLDDEVREMFTHLYELFHSGYIDQEWLTDGDSMMPVKLAGGKTAMVYTGPWTIKEVYKQNPNIQMGWFYLPDEEGNIIVRDIADSYWGITAECAEDETRYQAAVKFLEFFYSEERYMQVCNYTSSLGNIEGMDVAYELDVQKEIAEEFNANSNHTKQFLGDENYPIDFIKKVLDIEYDLLQDKITIDEAMQMCEAAYRESVGNE